MITAHTIWLLFLFLLILPLSVTDALGDDLADIQASFQAEVNAFNAHKQNAFITSAHTDIVVFGTLSPDVIRGKIALQELIRDYFATHADAFFAPVYSDFRVAGTVALAWGHYTLSDISIKDLAKDGPQQLSHGRYTFTFTKIDEKTDKKTDRTWQLVAMYFSPLQTFSPATSDTEKDTR